MHCEIRSIIGTRTEQQDHADMCCDEKGVLAVVCDGIGSRADGGASARMAVEMYIEAYKGSSYENFAEFIVGVTEQVNEKVREDFGSECGTTVVLAQSDGKTLHWLSVGDSRLYIKRGNKFRQITKDHNYRYILDTRIEKGLIDSETYESELHRGDHLASFLGMGPIDIMDINITPFTVNSGDILLLATDGLYKAVDDDDIADILDATADCAAMADELIAAAENCGKANIDNTTLALITV